MAENDKAKFPRPGPYDVVVDNYRGVPCDEFGRIKDPYACRDPKNARRTNPRQIAPPEIDPFDNGER